MKRRTIGRVIGTRVESRPSALRCDSQMKEARRARVGIGSREVDVLMGAPWMRAAGRPGPGDAAGSGDGAAAGSDDGDGR